MGTTVVRLVLLLLLCSSCLLPRLAAAPGPPIRAVNLGGWLVTEGWILPSLFYGIPNNDTLVLMAPRARSFSRPYLMAFVEYAQDGTKLQFKSVVQNRYLAAEQGGGAAIVANRTQASSWETFRVSDCARHNIYIFVMLMADAPGALSIKFISHTYTLAFNFYPVVEDQRDYLQLPGVRRPVLGR